MKKKNKRDSAREIAFGFLVFLFCLLLSVVFFGCKKPTSCYSFYVTRTTYSEPAQANYPQTESWYEERCGLTEKEANALAVEMTAEHKVKIGLTTLTVKDVALFRISND